MERYTPEELKFLKEVAPCCTRKETAEKFFAKFGQTHTETSITVKCKRMHYNHPSDGKFQKGMKSWHEGMPVEEWLSHFTEESKKHITQGKFNRSNNANGALPIGSERKIGGIWWIKVSEVRGGKNQRKRSGDTRWVPKHVYVYEKAHGKVPDGSVLLFLDGNKLNCELSNIRCITRQVLIMLTAQDWRIVDNPDLMKMAIGWCEQNVRLHHIIDGVNEKFSDYES